MTEQTISIQKKIFEIGAFSKTHVHELQNRVSNLVNYRLQKRMEDFFEEIIPEEILLKVERLEVDIGTVSWAGLEDEIEELLMNRLAEAFYGMLQMLDGERGAVYPGITAEPTSYGKLQFFSYYLANGIVPWNAGSRKRYDIDELFEELYMQNPEGIKAIIRKGGKQINSRRRIAYQFDEASIHKVVHIAEPASAGYILKTQKKILEVQQEKQIVRASEKDFGNNLWLFILNYLFGEMSSRFEEKMFIKSSLSQLAAHYNLNYKQLLYSFHDVLNNVKQEEAFQPLTKAVNELFIDEANALPEEKIPETIAALNTDSSVSLAKAIMLLRNYLFTGTLPVLHEQMQQSDIRQLLLSTAKNAPATLHKILFLLSKHYSGMNNLSKIIDEGDNEFLVMVLMKDNEKEVRDIVETILELHQLNSSGNRSRQELKLEIWQNLLKYFLTQSRTVFNAFEMTDEIIGFIARVTGKGKTKVAEDLKRSFQKKYSLSSESSATLILFEEIFESMKPESVSRRANEEVADFEKSIFTQQEPLATSYQQRRLFNLIHYVLKYGAMPWWGQEFYHIPLQHLLTDLYEQDFESLRLTFRKAATFTPMRSRLLQHIPITILKDLIFNLPNGDIVNASTSELLRILHKSKLLQYYTSEFIEKTIFTIAWKINANSGYNLFSNILFFEESIHQFSRILNISQADFIQALLNSAENEREAGFMLMRRTSQILQLNIEQKALQGVDEYNNRETDQPRETYRNAEADNTLANVKRIMNDFFPTEIADEEMYDQLTGVLQYFLRWNRLPDIFNKADKQEQRQLLRQLIKALYEINPRQLQLLIKTTNSSIVSAAYLAELFVEEEGIEQKRIAQLLLECLGKFMLEDKIETGRLVRTGISENKTLELTHFFDTEEADSSNNREEKILSEARKVMGFFLQNNRLPPGINKNSREDLHNLLYLLMVHLLERDKAFLVELFNDTGNSREAKIFLYDLLAMHNELICDQLAGLIKDLMEHDLKAVFLNDAGVKEPVSEYEFRELVIQQAAEIKPGAILGKRYAFLSSPAFSKMLLDKFGEAVFLDLPTAKARFENMPEALVKWWYHFLREAMPEGWQRDWVMRLFYRFNILFLSEGMNVHSAENYSNAWINYLTEESHSEKASLLNKILEHAIKQGGGLEEKLTDQNALIIQKLPALITKQEEAEILRKALQSEEERKFAVYSKQHGIISEAEVIKSVQNEIWAYKPEEDEYDGDNDRFIIESGESIYVSNAGLVLFHPFLDTYFSRTGLMENNIFIDDECRNRAALLLQYLATGTTACEEHELVLNKILCNVPLNEAIPVSFTVSEIEMNVTRELLEVIIERWEKMKNTSPDGFRHSFIMREGVMNFKEDYWTLKVEQRGYDILLQTLSWAFGYIKMSWMQHNLIVE